MIRADLTLEETYIPPDEPVAFPILALAGSRSGRDKEASRVGGDSVEFWRRATRAPFRERQVGTDWYILQEEEGVRAVLEEAKTFLLAIP